MRCFIILIILCFMAGQGYAAGPNFNDTDNKPASSVSPIFTGNVGIGTTDVPAALVVNGNIMAATPLADDHVATKAYVDAASGSKTMYKTSSTFPGNHNCDTTPSGCCASGYHMCDAIELLHGGRAMEISGTGCSTTPGVFGSQAWVDRKSNQTTANSYSDCALWSSNSGSYYGGLVGVAATGSSFFNPSSAACSTSLAVWCCQD